MLIDFFKKYSITADDAIVVACSAGPDSMLLLVETCKMVQEANIVVAHFNHCLRWEESDADEDTLHDYCLEHGLFFISKASNIGKLSEENKKSIEETARIERYAFLEDVRREYKAKYIFTAHHLDDSIETLLFHLIRGSKVHGLTGIPEQNGNILRPLLHMTKQEILRYLKEHNIPYRTDSTNLEDTYLRNHLRLNILPGFERINPEYRKNLRSFMGYMGELGDHLDQEVMDFLGGSDSFGVLEFQGLSVFLQREVIRSLYQETNNGTIGLSEWGIAEIIRFIGDKGNYTKKELGKLFLEKKNGVIYKVHLKIFEKSSEN